jgi:hypothetical protein
MISLVVITLLLIRAAQLVHGTSPWQETPWAPFASKTISLAIEPLGETFAARLEDVMIVAHIAVIMGFLVLVTYSKHLHIFTAPINVLTKRNPDSDTPALGALLPMMSNGKVLELEEADPRSTPSASPRSRTSSGPPCSTWPPAPSAAAARASARRGTPASRCRRSC